MASSGRQPDTPGWRVRVVPNRFPAFASEPGGSRVDGLLESRPAAGRQEIVVHSPRHLLSVTDLGAREIEDVAATWQARAAAAHRLGFGHVHALLNEGRAAGASLPHSHSQLVWLSEEPPALAAETRAGRGCVLCRLLDQETRQRTRLVAQQDGLVLLAAYAGRVPYELLLAPAECESDPWTSSRLAPALALLVDGVRSLHAVEGRVPLNAWLHPGRHWHLELVPRLTVFAGLELGAGYFVNTTAPEQAADVLRRARLPGRPLEPA